MGKINYTIYAIFLVIILALLGFMMYTGKGLGFDSKRSEFVEKMYNAQSKLSYYLGQTKAETFGIYTDEQIVTGSTDINNIDTTKIKLANGDDILPLVSKSDSETNKIMNDNLKKVLDVELLTQNDISYYIENGNTIKVKIDKVPSWWDRSLDCLRMGS